MDWRRPVFSKMRCELLPLVPTSWSPHFGKEFLEALQGSELEGTRILLAQLQKPPQKKSLAEFLAHCTQTLQIRAGVHGLVEYLGQVRGEISRSEISQNPRGQILEPGFRVIFPIFTPEPGPWALTLDESCWPQQ